MINLLQFGGTFASNGLAAIPVASGIQSIAETPSLGCVISPLFPAAPSVLNMATGAAFQPITAWDGGNFDVFPSGAAAIKLKTSTNYALPANFAMNPTAWSAWWVLNDTPVALSGSRDLLRPVDVTTTGYGPRVTMRTGGQFTVYNTDISIKRAEYLAALTSGVTAFMMVTFSTAEGLRIWKNGSVVASNLADKNALNEKYTAGAFQTLRGNSGTGTLLVGQSGVCGVDLALTENAAHRLAIQAYVTSVYGVVMA